MDDSKRLGYIVKEKKKRQDIKLYVFFDCMFVRLGMYMKKKNLERNI